MFAFDHYSYVPGLVVFINGDRAREWSAVDPPARRAAVLAQLERWFGPDAGQPLEYIEKVGTLHFRLCFFFSVSRCHFHSPTKQDWVIDEHTGGCPIATYGANVITRFGLARQLSEPCWPVTIDGATLHRLHWAGTESSDVGTGFMDGAVRAGKRAANAVIASSQLLERTSVRTSHDSGAGTTAVVDLNDSHSNDAPLLL
jgi:monoamine oxidase